MVTIVGQLRGKLLLFSILLFSIFLIGGINAQPPPSISTVINVDTGVAIDFPRQTIFEQNQAYNFHFHTFNISDGTRLDNSTINCSFELFDNTGNSLIHNTLLEFDDEEFFINVTGGNFSRLGDYHYLVDCEGGVGGHVSAAFTVTPTGIEFDIQQSVIVLGLILILLFLTAVCFFFGNELEFIPGKIFLIALGALFLMLTLGFSINTIQELMVVGSVFSGTFINLFRLILALISAGFLGILLYLITSVVKAFHKSRGVNRDED